MRNNERRTGAGMQSPAGQPQSLSFVVPTEFVELPSEGKLYPPDHPLHNQKTIEIKFMTAKEEDILSSEALLKNNLVLDRLIESLMVDDIAADTLLLGDRSAILMAARISGYGSEYKLTYRCPECFSNTDTSFDLKKHTLEKGGLDESVLQENNVVYCDDTLTFDVVLPVSGVEIGLRLLSGSSEKTFDSENKKDGLVTGLLASIISKINKNTDPTYIKDFVDVMPARDSKYIRELYPKLVPSVKMKNRFVCSACYTEKDQEVPLTAEFFWPE